MLDTGLMAARRQNPDRGRKSSLRADLVARSNRDLGRTGGQTLYTRDQPGRSGPAGGTASGPAGSRRCRRISQKPTPPSTTAASTIATPVPTVRSIAAYADPAA